MSSVVISGNTSGSISLDAPDVAGTNVITLPAKTGTAALTSDVIGVGQTWQNVTTSRTAGVPNTNLTGKPIQVSISAYRLASSGAATATVGGVQVATISNTGTNDVGTTSQVAFIVPDGASYVFSAAFTYWAELR